MFRQLSWLAAASVLASAACGGGAVDDGALEELGQHAAALASPVKVYSFNVHDELTVPATTTLLRNQMVNINPDIVCIQEVHSQAQVNNLTSGTAYSQSVYSEDLAIISKHAITSSNVASANNGQKFLGATVSVNGQNLYVACVHLDYLDYFSVPLEEAERDGEMAFHLSQIDQFAGNKPVIMAGDFNCATHLDWPDWPNAVSGDTTDGGAGWMVGRRLFATPYPGFSDAFKSGILQATATSTPAKGTWVPADYTLGFDSATTYRNERIDLILYRGFTTLTGQTTVDLPTNGGQDHRGVYATLTPLESFTAPAVPATALKLEYNSFIHNNRIRVVFANGPGNAKDWVGVYGVNDTPGVDASRLWKYVNNSQISGIGYKGGRVVLDATAVEDSPWPLAVGSYKAYLFQNDGYTILAGPITFTVSSAPLPSFSINKSVYAVGETIRASFSGMPIGDSHWVGIYRQADGAPGTISSRLWLYVSNSQALTNRKTQGTVYFRDNTAAGVSTWPLPAGNYKAYLLKDGGFTSAGGPLSFQVQ